MTTSRIDPISPADCFQFGCHPGVPCFNQCCRDLVQALTPYDIVRLKSALGMSSEDFIAHYAVIHDGPGTGLPVASLRFTDNAERTCPFVSPAGCRVYDHRPGSCRLYPLARAIKRLRRDGTLSEYYALLKEAHCRGFAENQSQGVRQWVTGQGLTEYLQMSDALMELIALKNRLRPGPLSADLAKLVRLAFYNVEKLKAQALDGDLEGMDAPGIGPLPDQGDDRKWLLWGLRWIRCLVVGFGR